MGIHDDDANSPSWSNETASYASSTHPNSLGSRSSNDSPFANSAEQDDPWDTDPLPPIPVVEEDSRINSPQFIIIKHLGGVE